MPHHPPYDPKMLRTIVESAASGMELLFKPMFGSILGYAGGKPFAALSDVGLALKLAGAEHVALLAVPGAVPLRFGPDGPLSKSYVVVPATMLADHDVLRDWMVRSIASLPAPKPKAAKAKSR